MKTKEINVKKYNGCTRTIRKKHLYQDFDEECYEISREVKKKLLNNKM